MSTDSETTRKYADILHAKRPPLPANHPRMDLQNRAKIFSPYDALNGFSAKIKEAARETEPFAALTEEEKSALSRRIEKLSSVCETDSPVITVTYFIPDCEENAKSRKSGGRYAAYTGKLRTVDTFTKELVFTDTECPNGKFTIRIERILKIT